jgi:hypothetical protein
MRLLLGVSIASPRFRSPINGTVKTVPHAMFIPYIFLIFAVFVFFIIMLFATAPIVLRCNLLINDFKLGIAAVL